MKRLSIFTIILVILPIIITGCSQKPIEQNDTSKDYEAELKSKDEKNSELEQKIKDLDQKIKDSDQKIKDLESEKDQVSSNNLISTAVDVMELIKAKDMNALSQYIHPTAGVRFTPYFHVDTQADQVFTASQVANLMQDSQILTWGNYDGSGEPIDLKFSDYYDKFIYDKDFVNPEIIGNNVAVGKGNTEDNITTAYPNGHFIEFHFSQFDPQFEGIDWESLRLVFEEYNNTWYLVGVIHGQWTI